MSKRDWPWAPGAVTKPRLHTFERRGTTRGDESVYQWPWSNNYETEALRWLAKAGIKFIRDRPPGEKYRNKQVVQWLVDQGASRRKATIIARLLRPPYVSGLARRTLGAQT